MSYNYVYKLINIERAPLSAPLDDMLPTDAIHKGYGLSWWSPVAFGRDPVILYKHNEEIYRWDYIPSLREVWEKIEELEDETSTGSQILRL